MSNQKGEQREHHSPGLHRLQDQALIIPAFGAAPSFLFTSLEEIL